MKTLFILAASLLVGSAYAADGSARYGPIDSQSGSAVDATPGTKRAEQRSVCERFKGKEKQSCLKKKPQELEASKASQPKTGLSAR
jgi:hypothetical protein